MKFSQVQQSINHVLQCLKPVLQANHIEIEDGGSSFSWRNRQTGIGQNIYYPVEYQHLIDTHQYSLLLQDGAFFQFYYRFDDKDKLISGRLAYYPPPIKTIDTVADLLGAAEAAIDREDDALYDHLFNWAELLESNKSVPANTSHIRFDYDPRTVAHEPSHLQFSGINELRLPSNFFPQPYAFIQLVAPLINGINEKNGTHIGHARNNCFLLPTVDALIRLSHDTAR